MDEVERLIQVFSARGVMASAAAKLDILLDLVSAPGRGTQVRVRVVRRRQ